MKTSILLASGLALMAAGCGQTGARPRTLAKLDCPQTQGALTRLSAAADGKACVYRTPAGEEINLQLVAVKGDARATLGAIELALKGQSAARSAKEPTTAGKAEAAARAEAERVQAEAAADAKTDVASDDGRTAPDGASHAQVDLPGIHINADDEDATVRIGPLQIDAKPDDSTVRVIRVVRMRGEVLSRVKRGLRATYVYAGKDLPDGYRFVGYEASGLRTGPLVVATLRSKLDDQPHEEIYAQVKKLVRRNGGA